MNFALSIIFFRFTALTSSTWKTSILALHGPTLSIVSRDAARIEVSTLSRLEGTKIFPFVFPPLAVTITSILPILPVFCRSRRSRSAPRSPSVCPKIAPTISGRSITPSALILEWMIYFVVSVFCMWILHIIVNDLS